MAVFTCKMCGARLDISSGESIIECAYCGTQQTLPRLNDDRRANLYDRANHYRRSNDFDKAAGIYEQILNEDGTDAEAYWSLVLCHYGIEYVEDPISRKRKPTVNRIQYTSIFDDENYQSALRYADARQSAIYKEEAAAINEIQKGYLAISQKETPFDVFICYKESDGNGKRTPDSVLAQELYYELTEAGFKVFFARITLENKLGSAYEPYIFSALNSSKVMVVLGTKPEYFNAVWVKNEWSRYLNLIKNGDKKILIPAYRDMDPYNMPEEFSHLQAQNMASLGFMQDLIRGIEKIVGKEQAPAAAASGNPSAVPLLKRAYIFLEEGSFQDAEEYCEKVLDMDPENASAYICKLMAQLRVTKESALANGSEPLENIPTFKTALRFADAATFERLMEYNRRTRERADAKKAREQEALRQQEYQRRLEESRRQEEMMWKEAWRTTSTEINTYHTQQIQDLKKQRSKHVVRGIVWLCFFWPVSVYHFIKVYSLTQEINRLS